ncbi:MAG: alpha/beta hydrolase [Candidatus Moraniibacteriota bacterium]
MIIKNRKGQNISVVIDKNENTSSLAFVTHGLGGFKEQLHIRVLADVLKENGYTVISFDTTNTFGKSDGNYSDATTTNYYEDLEDVIGWAKDNFQYKDPFVLAGHSIGGLSISLFAEKYPNEVKALVPVSVVVSGTLWRQAQDKEMLENWEKKGIWIREASNSSSGKQKILKWAFAEDIMKYDLLNNVEKLTMPVLLIVGDQDLTTPVSHQKIFFEQLPGKKELHIIKSASHVFKDEAHLDEIGNIMSKWLGDI